MRTLSDAAEYKFPDGPTFNAVIGLSPGKIVEIFTLPDNTVPEELNKNN